MAPRLSPPPESAAPELLFFTTLAPFKGLDTLVEAYRRLLPSFPSLRLTVAGSEHPRFPGYLESVRHAYANLPGITWRGEVPDAQVRDLFARAMLVVLPYRASTGASSVFLQAAAWGRPVVASDLLDMRGMARDCGLSLELFETGNVPQLANALQTLLQDAPRRQAMVAHNFRAIQRMRPEDTCRLYLQAFNMALETRQHPQRLRIPSAFPLEYS